MGLFEKIFPKKNQNFVGSRWEPLTAYQAQFNNWGGDIYESELVRSAIDCLARNSAKLRPEFTGSAKSKLINQLKKKPNEFQTWYQFIYRLRTIYEIQNNAIIVPMLDKYDQVTGLFPVLPSSCEVVDYKGVEYLRYHFANTKIGAIELSRCGLVTKHQYKNDIFGDRNSALNSTMALIDINKQGIKEAIKSSASFRFMAQMINFANDADIAAERKRFVETNFRADSGELLLFSNKVGSIQQINSKPYSIDDKTMDQINKSIYNYFGVSEEAIQNRLVGDSAAAFYEGAVEPFAIQASEAITFMLYTPIEISTGNSFMFSANRVQFMSNTDKLNFVTSMADRGLATINELRDVLNMPPVEGGDRLIARGEYYYMDPTADPDKQEDEDNAE